MRVVIPRFPAEINITTALGNRHVWHERLGHQGKRHVPKVKERMEINMSMAETGGFFDGCVLGKAIWNPFIPQPVRSQIVGQLIQSDVNGPK
jgi:hypothetical protein